MSKVSIKMIVALLALAMKGLNGAIRAIRIIRDLMDDGQLNGSADLPSWLDRVQSAIDSAAHLVDAMSGEFVAMPSLEEQPKDSE